MLASLTRPFRLRPLALALVAACASPAPPPPPAPVWSVGTVYPSPAAANARGFLDRRGLIHAHSVYSHDACDNKPLVDGVRDPVCFDDFRRDLCAVQHDFVFLTDHHTSFAATEYPDALLYRPDRGDVLVTRDGHPTASRAACPDGHAALIMAGTESGTMPVGLEDHVAPADTRGATYDEISAEAIGRLKAHGAVALVAHTEGWTADQLSTLPLDGFEMYNLHANTLWNASTALELVGRLMQKDTGLPRPDLVFLELFGEDPRYLKTWGTVLARGVRRVTTMGTDCHRNSFPQLMEDGERVDSYRRMMSWFSNHLLVRPAADGTFDDRSLKDALRAGRLFGVFEALGTPVGFDARAEARGATFEMGDEVALADAPVLHVTRPTLRDLDPRRTPPTVTVRVVRAVADGWQEVAKADGDVTFAPTQPGAYRAEVRILPLHLREDLRDDVDRLLDHDYVWIYANPIYVR